MVTRLIANRAEGRIFFGWFVVAASLLVSFGVIGSQFSFGVFMKPMTEDFGWSRATLSLAFGTTFMLSGLLRPLTGYLADRYSAKWVALSGVMVMGAMLLVLTQVQNLTQLYVVFAAMALGITLGSGSALAKIVSAWFHRSRGVTLGLLTGGGSIGAVILVPAASSFIEIASWREGYLFLGLFLIVLVLPLGLLLIRDKPQDMGLEPMLPTEADMARRTDPSETRLSRGRDSTFTEALQTGLFWRLTFGYFV
jgi:sugar phosphate permease